MVIVKHDIEPRSKTSELPPSMFKMSPWLPWVALVLGVLVIPDQVGDLVTGEPRSLAEGLHWGPVGIVAENLIVLISWSLVSFLAIKELLHRRRNRSTSAFSDGTTKPNDS